MKLFDVTKNGKKCLLCEQLQPLSLLLLCLLWAHADHHLFTHRPQRFRVSPLIKGQVSKLVSSFSLVLFVTVWHVKTFEHRFQTYLFRNSKYVCIDWVNELPRTELSTQVHQYKPSDWLNLCCVPFTSEVGIQTWKWCQIQADPAPVPRSHC